MYYDGANANALMGNSRPGDMGFDLMHLNLHKTFSIPHGGGGAGAGPVGVAASARAVSAYAGRGVQRIGRRGRLGTVGGQVVPARFRAARCDRFDALVLVELRPHGARAGICVRQRVRGSDASLEARRPQRELHPGLDQGRDRIPYDENNRHEFVVSAQSLKRETGVRALDIGKALLDRGYHAPTVYFPLLVPECIMIEPTETESKETLDAFIADFRAIFGRGEDRSGGDSRCSGQDRGAPDRRNARRAPARSALASARPGGGPRGEISRPACRCGVLLGLG